MNSLMQNSNLPRAVIVDIDGTLAKINGRSPYEWGKVDTDLPNEPVVELVKLLSKVGKVIVFLSGRDGSCAGKTIVWINQHLGLTYHKDWFLFMRTPNDNRKDAVIKKELFEQNILNRWYIDFVLDDRNQVVDLWRKEIGLPCFQVDYGDF